LLNGQPWKKKKKTETLEEEQEEEVVVYADEGDMLDLKLLRTSKSAISNPILGTKLLHPQRNQQRMSPFQPTWLN